jgi:pyrroline-5-carboxylate reductase
VFSLGFVSTLLSPCYRAFTTPVARTADVIFVAVKPQHVAQVLSEVRPVLTEAHTVVSIAAGITIDK